MSSPFIEDNDQTRARREHLERIRELVGNAYPNKFRRSSVARSAEGEDTVSAIVREFRQHEPEVEEGQRPSPEQLEAANEALKSHVVRVSGRIATPPRVMGKAAFVHLSDGRERLQIYVRKQDASAISNDSGQPVEEEDSGWKLLQHLDHGDFVGVEGFLFVTKTGELSVHVRMMQFLSKALLPMPDKMHGIADPEIRQRQRYADLIASSLKVEREPDELTTRDVFERRSKLITHMRRHLEEHGYVEVETPMLSPIASGAAARPFETFHKALGIPLYLRIAPELYLKRLLVGGFERVYELNRNFRNEGISIRHNPEFTMLDFYCAYMDADGMMDFCEEMLRKTIQSVVNCTTILFQEHSLDFGRKFERLTMREAIINNWPPVCREVNGELVDASWLYDVKKLRLLQRFVVANYMVDIRPEADIDTYDFPYFWSYEDADAETKFKIESVAQITWQWVLNESSSEEMEFSNEETEIAHRIAHVFEAVAEPHLTQPTFITDFPKPISPLSKASPDNPAIAERFELYIAGMEVANGFSELNDPLEQYERFEEQTRQRERGDDEAMQMDVDYVRALSYGMPPAAGIGIGIDRLTMLLTNRRSIRDVILFPHMRPRQQQAEDGSAEVEESGAAEDKNSDRG